MTDSTYGGVARSALIISRRNPNTVEPGTAIGYWSDEIIEEAKRRGGFPIVRIMWPEDLEVFGSARGAEVAAEVARARLSASSELVEWMSPSEYAKRQGVSRSTVYEWLKKPKFPRRRGCRGGKSIPVKEADEFLKLGGLTRGTKR